MIEKIFSFIGGGSITVYIWIFVLGLISSLGYGVYFYHEQYQEQIIEKSILKEQNDVLVLKIKEDSDAVIKLGKDSQSRELKAKKAIIEAQKVVKDFNTRAQEIMIINPSNTNLCTDSNNLFNLYIGEK